VCPLPLCRRRFRQRAVWRVFVRRLGLRLGGDSVVRLHRPSCRPHPEAHRRWSSQTARLQSRRPFRDGCHRTSCPRAGACGIALPTGSVSCTEVRGGGPCRVQCRHHRGPRSRGCRHGWSRRRTPLMGFVKESPLHRHQRCRLLPHRVTLDRTRCPPGWTGTTTTLARLRQPVASVRCFGPQLPRCRSCSARAVSHDFGGLLRHSLCRSVAPCCRP
jgi:hypothetical protein